jgi:Cache domain
MFFRRKRLIPWLYRVVFASVLAVLLSLVVFLVLREVRTIILIQAQSELSQSARELTNLARLRYDLVHTYQEQEEQHVVFRLNAISNLMVNISRQSELASARKFMNAAAAKAFVIGLISSADFGRSVYGYIFSSTGKVIYHPYLPEGFDISQYRFAREMIEKQSGNIRYMWKSPGESDRRERVVSYRTVYSWDWIIGVGAIIENAVDNSFEPHYQKGYFELVKSYPLNWRGKAAVFSDDGEVLAHPMYEQMPVAKVDGAMVITQKKSGVCSYVDSMNRRWWAASEFFTPQKWIISVFAREDEILHDFHRFQFKILIGIAVFFICLIILQTYWSRRLIFRVHKLLRHSIKPTSTNPES